ncbi:MAG: hybrid sensor histidine kinase/response regulator [bacterium]|nr:hybrid sensor histidine kinase/response regulator [bacterium]
MENQELLEGFIEEAQGHLQEIEPDFLLLEQEGDNVDSEVVNRIFRSIHSIKGASGFFGLEKIGKLSHVMESLLNLLREKKLPMSRELTDALLSGVDDLRAMIDDITSSEEFDIVEDLEILHSLLESAEKGSDAAPQQKEENSKQSDETEDITGLGFEVSEEDVDRIISHGMNLYSFAVSLQSDVADEEKEILEYFSNIEAVGEILDSYLDANSIEDLDNCLDKETFIHVLFASVLEQDLIPTVVELDNDRISVIDVKEKRDLLMNKLLGSIKEKKEKKTEAAKTVELKKDDVPVKDTPAENEDKQPKVVRKIQAEEKLKVGVNLLNDLVNLAGELVLGRNQLIQISQPLEKDSPGLNNVLGHVSRITTEMQGKIMHLRMQPVSIIFSKFHRIVRDLSKNLKKDAVLETTGDEVELDKSIVESLSDPLTHLIRNSMDHGLESSDEREANGKPRQGTIQLRAFHEGGQVHLEIQDDGKGIDAKIVGQKAVEKGLITQEEMESLSDKELVRMVLKPGFSTAKEVSSLSGRGVGMDVVVTNIEKLGGTVEIDTVLGKGTTMRLILPLTLAIVSGLVVKVNENRYIVPEVSIDEMVRIKCDEMKSRINHVQDSFVLRLRDRLLPIVNLRDVLFGGEPSKDFFKNKCSNNEPVRVLILKYGLTKFGLVVDEVDSFEEIVVKPLPRFLKKMNFISGATIMGDGNVVFILDVVGIVDSASLKDISEMEDDTQFDQGVSADGDMQSLIIFDNNTEERFALPLELISRLEQVDSNNIEIIKDEKYIQYQEQNLHLIYLEDYLPVNRPDRSSDQHFKIIIPKQMKYPIGIVFSNIVDTIRTEVKLDTTTIMAPGIFGSSVLNDKITIMLDMFRLFEMAAPQWYGNDTVEELNLEKKNRILLVEDTPFFRMIESEYLESAGYEVVQAEDGEKAMNILEKEEFDAVVLDIVMPVMDGWEVIRQIRKEKKLHDLPVLAVTSLWDEESKKRGIEEGFTDWEAKLNKSSLLDKLGKMIKTKEKVS